MSSADIVTVRTTYGNQRGMEVDNMSATGDDNHGEMIDYDYTILDLDKQHTIYNHVIMIRTSYS